MGKVILIIIIIVIVVAVAGYFVRQRTKMAGDPEYAARVTRRKADRVAGRQRRKAERAEMKVKKAKFQEAIAPEKADYVRAKQEYNSRVDAAEDHLRRMTREHEKVIREQERAISDIEKRYSAQVAAIGHLKLFLDHIATRDVTAMLNGTFTAQALNGNDLLAAVGSFPEFALAPISADNMKPASGGSVIGGIGSPEEPWPVVVDPGYDYLIVRGTVVEQGSQQLLLMVPLDEKKRDDGLAMVDHINTTAASSEANDRAKQEELQAAYEVLDRLNEDTEKIEEAQEVLDRERADHQAVDEAQERLKRAEQSAREALDYHR